MLAFDQSFGPDDRGLNKQLLRGIYSSGFEHPTKVQQQAIIPLALGHDAIIQAQSGTGKTAAFSIGGLSQIDPQLEQVQLLILEPSIPLARQTGEVVARIGKCLFPDSSDWLMIAVGGGTHYETEARRLLSGKVRVIVGTTGRVSHLIRERLFGPGLKTIIFDEADDLLAERFTKEVNDILHFVPKHVQVGLFSATMSPENLQIARKLVRTEPKAVEILLNNDKLSLAGIKQYRVSIPGHNPDEMKLAVINELYQHFAVSRCIIFTNSRKRCEWLTQNLKEKEYSVVCLHGELPREERTYIEEEFRSGRARLLVSSDLLSRGFDIQDLSLIINFDVPNGPMAIETYIHRIGRTGRYGRKGMAISLVKPVEDRLIDEINSQYGGQITDLPANIVQVFGEILGTNDGEGE